jgi:plastocyanin
MRNPVRVAILGAGLLASAFVCAGVPADMAIKMQKESFVPAKTAVAAGTRITWTNTDSVPHSVTANDKRFDSGPILPGKSFQWMADGGGTIAYHCIFHPSMTATLTVRAPQGASAK